MLMSVDFPDPEGPMMATNSAGPMSRFTSFSTGTGPARVS